jgi:hypothetical protein
VILQTCHQYTKYSNKIYKKNTIQILTQLWCLNNLSLHCPFYVSTMLKCLFSKIKNYFFFACWQSDFKIIQNMFPISGSINWISIPSYIKNSLQLRVTVFNTTFKNIIVEVLLVEETRVPRENHRPVTRHWQTLSHNVVSSTSLHERGSNSQL